MVFLKKSAKAGPFASLLFGVIFFNAVQVYGKTDITVDELYRLALEQKKQLAMQQQQIKALQTLVSQQQQQLSKNNKINKYPGKRKKRSGVKVSINQHGLRAKTRDGNFAMKIGGRIQMDGAYYNDKITPMGNGLALRRARINVSGKLFRDWGYFSSVDFAKKDKAGVRGMYLNYKGWKDYAIKFGQFQEPFSLEGMNSSNTITFMERGLPYVFAPDYHLGASLSHFGNWWQASAGIFGEAIQTKKDNIDDGWGGAGRVTFAPWHQDDRVLHVGASAEYRVPNTAKTVRYRYRPESWVTNVKLVDTGKVLNVDNTLKMAAELAFVDGPFSLQGEYVHDMVQRSNTSNLQFNGWYAYASWFLTGESRPYNVKKGSFTAVDPISGYGAWELGLRFSSLDLTDKDITGGREQDITVGLNWYANSNIRFMANYVRVNTHPNRKGFNDDPDILQFRGQIFF